MEIVSREYTYLLVKVYNVFGYRWERKELPSYLSFTITEDKNSKWVTVYSRIHMNKEVIIQPSYHIDWTDEDIIKDCSSEITSWFTA